MQTIDSIIASRRSAKTAQFNGQPIAREEMQRILALGDWAPTHAHTEPWLFLVYEADQARALCEAHADLYKAHTSADTFSNATYDRLRTNGDKASHIVIACMRSGDNPKIPVIEEICSAACAIQNILLAATAAGIGTFWSTGGMVLKQPFKDYLSLRPQDQVLGMIYFGYTDAPPTEGKRLKPLEEKIRWM